jgi:vacuolar-type H+-ATPase subunit E/Vma4
MGLQEIINRILEDARNEANRIVKQAEEQRLAELRAAKEEYQARAEEIKEKAKIEAEQLKRRTEARLKLEEAKRFAGLENEIGEVVFKEAIKKLQNSKTDLIKKLFFKLILISGLKGNEKIRVRADFKKVFSADFLGKLNKALPDGRLELDKEYASESDLELRGDNYVIRINLSDVFENNKTTILPLILRELENNGE